MRRTLDILSAMAVIIVAAVVFLSADKTPQQKYIDQYSAAAVREMYRSGVPASITLAQGILESRSGLSRLATEGNNHFGIKCHNDWKGKKMYADDDRKGECFRVYPSAEESFRDHSDFLRYRDRYKFLFEYEITDYKSWAYGLKKAGYATSPTYAQALIKVVEDNNLSIFDTMTIEGVEEYEESMEESLGIVASDGKSHDEVQLPVKDRESKRVSKAKAKAARKKKSQKAKEEVKEEIPESPLSIEEARPAVGEIREQFRFSLTRQVYTRNGVPFIYSLPEETYASIAESNNLFFKEILRFNDLQLERRLEPGTIVYLQAKKSQAQKGLDKYIVETDGEDLRDICQRFGVKMSSVRKMNGFSASHTLREGDTIILRKKAAR